MKCPLCGKKKCLYHIERWGKLKVKVWTIICNECLRIKES